MKLYTQYKKGFYGLKVFVEKVVHIMTFLNENFYGTLPVYLNLSSQASIGKAAV